MSESKCGLCLGVCLAFMKEQSGTLCSRDKCHSSKLGGLETTKGKGKL